MITHLVLLKPRPDLAENDRRAFVSAFERAVRDIPTVKHVRIGIRVTHGAGYEQVAPDAADVLAIIDFEDLAGLQAYLSHPAHEDVGLHFGRSLSSAMVYDFETAGIELLQRLV
jgi:hypothetical protein